MNNLEPIAQGFLITYIFLIGLCVGSFLNVVILRGLSGEDICFSRSRCPSCGNLIKWYMNIPLLSFVFLKGKCAYCKTKISWQYPLVELTYGIILLVLYFVFGLTLKALFLAIIFALFVVLSGTDFKECVVVDIHTYILAFVGLLYSGLQLGEINLVQGIIGAVFGFLLFEILSRVVKLFVGCRMFGEGDSLIAIGLGAIFGWKTMIIIFALSVLIQTFSAIPILIKKAFMQKKAKLGISYILVLFGLASIFVLNVLKINLNENIRLGLVLGICVVMLWTLKNILFEIKERKLDETKAEEEKFSLMPFGPALIFASVLCTFFLPQIKEFILSLIV